MIFGSACPGISHAKSHKSVIQTPAVNTQSSPLLVRAIGRWSLAALTVNSIIGSGVFGLPALVAGLVGAASPLAVLLAGAAMGVVCVAGAIYLISAHRIIPATTFPASAASWFKAMLLLVFAYGGFESALTPMAEAKDPRRDTVFALFVAVLTCIVIYTWIQWV